jgi:hypothetical protein
MGLSGGKTTTKTKPIYGPQIEGAAGNINSAYGAQAPKISAVTDALGGLVPGLIDKYKNGDPGLNAAGAYDADVLGGKYLDSNPYIDDIADRAGNDARNQTAGALGTRGLTGGSAFGDIISRNVARAGTDLRFANYNSERGRMDSASGRAPGLAAASQLPIATLLEIAQAQQMPVQTAAGAGSAIGGLLGQYTNTEQKSSPSLGSIIAQLAGNAAGAWASGGFR